MVWVSFTIYMIWCKSFNPINRAHKSYEKSLPLTVEGLSPSIINFRTSPLILFNSKDRVYLLEKTQGNFNVFNLRLLRVNKT